VTDALGTGVAGVSVHWTTSGGYLAEFSKTDASGVANAQWTAGPTAGTQTGAATVAGVNTPATFSVTVIAGPLAKLTLAPDSISLASIGDSAFAILAATDAFNNPVLPTGVTFTSANPAVATVNSTGVVKLAGPGRTTITATSGSATASIVVRQVCGGVSGSALAVGSVTTLTGTAAAEICVQGAAGAEFVAIPFFGPMTGGSLSLTVSAIGTTSALGPPSPSISTASGLRGAIMSGGHEVVRDEAWETRFRERALSVLNPKIGVGGAIARQSRTGAQRRSISFAAVPNVGDIVTFNVNAGPTNNDICTTPVNHGARVMAVSNNAIVANDTLNPASGFTTADYQTVAAAFDTLMFPTDTANFGAPTDIDGNGKIILLFTRAVNELTPAGNTTSFVGGFFYNRDIFPKATDVPPIAGRAATCATSNWAEMFYLLAPDPSGTINGHAFSTTTVKQLTLGTVSHEFQHLINATRHLWINTSTNAFETTFLDEGLAHAAEELNFYAASHYASRQNLGASDMVLNQATTDAANNFALQNQKRFRNFLIAPDANSPYANNDDLETRGATWSFLRYAVDRVAAVDKNSFFNLVNPNAANMTGIVNLQRVFGNNLAAQFRDWSVANYVDDAVSGVPTLDLHPSWNTRSIESSTVVTTSGVFPLKTQQLPAGTKLSLSIVDGGSAYIRFGVGAGTVGGASISSAAGALPNTLTVTLVRTK
jgi:hypothetical protein